MTKLELAGLINADLTPVEPINERRGGWSGVYKLTSASTSMFLKRQCNHYYRRFCFKTPTLYREYRNYLAFAKLNIPTPEMLLYLQSGTTAIMITRLQPGLPIREWLNESPSIDQREQVLAKLGELLFRLHSHHRTHGCLYGKHIFIDSNNSTMPVSLIDLEKARFCLRNKHGAIKDLSRLFRYTPELGHKDRIILTRLYCERWPDFNEQLSQRINSDAVTRAQSRTNSH